MFKNPILIDVQGPQDSLTIGVWLNGNGNMKLVKNLLGKNSIRN